ncbi:hypothetical protein B0H13DRAFT_1128653 [Mycena leptocephala]|nr:hypothetical protein B0H13DRAFT_1128653 [Mycena leptocephala]
MRATSCGTTCSCSASPRRRRRRRGWRGYGEGGRHLRRLFHHPRARRAPPAAVVRARRARGSGCGDLFGGASCFLFFSFCVLLWCGGRGPFTPLRSFGEFGRDNVRFRAIEVLVVSLAETGVLWGRWCALSSFRGGEAGRADVPDTVFRRGSVLAWG